MRINDSLTSTTIGVFSIYKHVERCSPLITGCRHSLSQGRRFSPAVSLPGSGETCLAPDHEVGKKKKKSAVLRSRLGFAKIEGEMAKARGARRYRALSALIVNVRECISPIDRARARDVYCSIEIRRQEYGGRLCRPSDQPRVYVSIKLPGFSFVSA